MTSSGRPPTVSVIIPAYNAEASIAEALDSVRAQTFGDYEIVVVDDGSLDATADVVARAGGPVVLVRQANQGPARARNVGVAASRGRLLAFLDADDAWLPRKLAAQVDYFDRYPETGLLHTAALASGGSALSGRPGGPVPPRYVFCQLFQTDYDINTLTVMTPRAVFDAVGGFNERREIHVEDWELWLRIAASRPVGYLPEPTAIRRPGGAMSADFEKTFRGQAEVIRAMAPVCLSACAGATRPGACLRRRWYRYHWELGYARRRAGRRAAARRAFLNALRFRPLAAGAYVQLAASSLPAPLASAGHAARRSAGRLVRRYLGWRAEPGEPVSLVNDTLYRRARQALADRAHAVDTLVHRARAGGRVRVLFEAASPMSFVVFRPVYERLRQDPRFEFWFTASGQTWDPRLLYERVGITSNVVSSSRAAWMKVDACVNTDFWDATWLYRRARRIHLFHGVAGKYGLDAPVDLAPTVRSFDRLLFPNEDRLRRYVEAGLVEGGSPVAVLAGYPKLDCLVDGSLDIEAIRRQLDIGPTDRTVLYAPTWSPYSSLNTLGEQLILALAEAGFLLVVKLHDRSYDPASRGSGGVDWVRKLDSLRANPRIRVVTAADATPFLAVADALVTDHSSIGFEYTLVDRPLVIVDCPELIAHARVTPSKAAELRSTGEVVRTAGDVVAAVVRQLEDPSSHREDRRAVARRFFYRPGTATDRAVASVYDVLGLEAPDSMASADSRPMPALASMTRG